MKIFQWPVGTRARSIGLASFVLMLTGCQTTPAPPPPREVRKGADPVAVAPVARETAVNPTVLGTSPKDTPLPSSLATATPERVAVPARAAQGEFSTRHARFQPVEFQQLPDWSQQSFDEALAAFRKGCGVLGKRPVWADSCREAEKLGNANATAIKDYFEREFFPYQVLQSDRSATGSLTGYFEPLLRGSRDKRPPFDYPVYETPSDLLLLDAREVDMGAAYGEQARYLLDGREIKLIVPKPGGAIPAGPRVYKLALGPQQVGTRDRKYRVRLEGNQIVSYPTRQEIEKAGRIAAKPIAWVESREALYAMQIQGSGRILFPNGSVVRVGFAEQNGHSFLPKAQSNELALAPKTRSMQVQTDADGKRAGFASPLEAARAAGKAGQGQRVGTTSLPSRETGANLDQETIGAGFYGSRFESIRDPSYVFFREIPPSGDGPIGAMGIALTAGRSIAVDPRVTPLGSPVMIERRKEGPADSGRGGRLMVAQDTGGAIRGAVRADYFWGFGKTAANQALRTNDMLKMWVLLPKAFKPAAASGLPGGKTRSLLGEQSADCLIPDTDLCVD